MQALIQFDPKDLPTRLPGRVRAPLAFRVREWRTWADTVRDRRIPTAVLLHSVTSAAVPGGVEKITPWRVESPFFNRDGSAHMNPMRSEDVPKPIYGVDVDCITSELIEIHIGLDCGDFIIVRVFVAKPYRREIAGENREEVEGACKTRIGIHSERERIGPSLTARVAVPATMFLGTVASRHRRLAALPPRSTRAECCESCLGRSDKSRAQM